MSPTTGSKKSKRAASSASSFSPGDEYDGPMVFAEDEFHHPVEVSDREDGTEEHSAIMDVRLVTDDGVTYRVADDGATSHNERHGDNVVSFPQE